MAHRIEVGFKTHVKDALGEKVGRMIVEDLHLQVEGVRVHEVYTVDMDLSPEDLRLLAKGAFTDPIVQECSVDRPLARDFDWLIEVGFKPGVTDNVGRTARETIEFVLGATLGPTDKVYTSKQYLVRGKLTAHDVNRIAKDLLANELIHTFIVVSRDEWDPERGVGVSVPKVVGEERGDVEEIDLNVSNEDLVRISRDRVLALSLDEMKALKSYAEDQRVQRKRKEKGLSERLTDVEVEAIAQTWSEHCKHKIFSALIQYDDGEGRTVTVDGLFKTFIRGATEKIRASLGKEDWCVSVFEDNAGVIAFNDDYNLVFKVETHNSPSALDPYGGALTGIVGVNRDPFGTGKGAKLIFNTDVFCFADPFFPDELPPRVLHPKRIYQGVREGVEHGGNKSGIPTVNGAIVFDNRYLGKPLVYCGTGGIMPREIRGEPSHVKGARPGDCIVMTGGRIGKDGIHGATFSSEELHEGSPVTAVQIGDPITQKRMTDFLLKARDEALYTSITDNGAGGLSSSVGEMALSCGGCALHLERAPLKYAGLSPWEILLSEAQERMTLAVPPDNVDTLLKLAEKMGVEATVLGNFTEEKHFHVLYRDRTVAFLDMEFLHHGCPQMRLNAAWKPPTHAEPRFEDPGDLTPALTGLLGRLNICSKESVIRQYDHEVQGGSVVKPLVGERSDGPGDAAVLRPLLDSFEGVVVANGICPRYSDIDAYWMMACTIDEAVRNAVSVGASIKRMAGLDNFCWCDPVESEKTPDGRFKLAQLVRANMALFDMTTAFGVPCISGKDSMKNDYLIEDKKISIPPTVLFSVIAKIDDVRKAITMDVKSPGDLVYVLGETFDEMGGSEYYAMHGFVGSSVPKVAAAKARALYEALGRAIEEGLVASCHDCSDGGLGVALAETSFAGGYGMEVSLSHVPKHPSVARNDMLLFSESQSRFVATVHPSKQKAFEEYLKGCAFGAIGKVTEGEKLAIFGLEGSVVVSAPLMELKEAWQKPLNF
jgi:phosphoribosylformylglycinamidine synthase